MAASESTYIGIAGKTDYSITFEYIDQSDIRVTINGTATTDFTFSNATTIQLNTAPAAGDKIRIYRVTPSDSPKATFFPGSSIRSQDLNKDFEQILHLSNELKTDKVDVYNGQFQTDVQMNDNRLTGLKDVYSTYDAGTDISSLFTDSDAASIGFVKHFFYDNGAETIFDNEYSMPSDWKGDNLHIATTAATSKFVRDKMADNLTQNIHIRDGDGLKISDDTDAFGNNSNPTQFAPDGTRGQVRITIEDGEVPIEKIKPSDIVSSVDQTGSDFDYKRNWYDITEAGFQGDGKIPTAAAVANRTRNFVQAPDPIGDSETEQQKLTVGQFWFEKDNDNKLSVWDGTNWLPVVAGVKEFPRQPKLCWVDWQNGSDSNDGHRVVDAMKTIQGAVQKASDGDIILVQPGTYREALPINMGTKKNLCIVGLSQRNVFVHPHPYKKWNQDTADNLPAGQPEVVDGVMISGFVDGTSEYRTMFKMGSGSYLQQMTFAGMKATATRQADETLHADHVLNSIYPDATYGIPNEQGWFVALSNEDENGNPIRFTKSPFVENCTAFSDSHISNYTEQEYNDGFAPEGQSAPTHWFDPTGIIARDNDGNIIPPVNNSGFAGDTTSAPTGGAVLCDGDVPFQQARDGGSGQLGDSPLKSILTSAFTFICLDGPGCLVTNGGYAQLVGTFGTFCSFHAAAINGGQINMSNCVTDFGRWGLIADGKSPSANFQGLINTSPHDDITETAQLRVTISGDESFRNQFAKPKPSDHMLMKVYYNTSPNPDNTPDSELIPIIKSEGVVGSGDYTVTLARKTAANRVIDNNKICYFFLQSLISTGGHVFEFAGAGTDYGHHPDNGGTPDEDKQVINRNAGKVYISSTDHNGRFKVGNVISVIDDSELIKFTGTVQYNGDDLAPSATTDTTNADNITSGELPLAQVPLIPAAKISSLPEHSAALLTEGTLPDPRLNVKLTGLDENGDEKESFGPYTNATVTADKYGRITAVSGGVAAVTSISLTEPLTNSGTAYELQLDVSPFDGVNEGTVPASDAGHKSKFLRSDAQWSTFSLTGEAFEPGGETSGFAVDLKQTYGEGDADEQIETVTFKEGQNISFAVGINEVTINASTDTTSTNVQATPPTDAANQTIWWDNETGESYFLYVNPDGHKSWVQLSPQQRGTGEGTVKQVTTTSTDLTVDLTDAGHETYNLSLPTQAGLPLAATGSASKSATVTVDTKGRVTALSENDIAIDITKVTRSSGDIWDVDIDGTTVEKFKPSVIPNLHADKINDGVLGSDRIPDIYASKIVTVSPSSLSGEVGIAVNSVSAELNNPNDDTEWLVTFNATTAGAFASNIHVGDSVNFVREYPGDWTNEYITSGGQDGQHWVLLANILDSQILTVNVVHDDYFKCLVSGTYDGSAIQWPNQPKTLNTPVTANLAQKIDPSRIPDISAKLITSGNIDDSRIPQLKADKIGYIDDTAFNHQLIPSLRRGVDANAKWILDVKDDTAPILGGNLKVGDNETNTIYSDLTKKISFHPGFSQATSAAGESNVDFFGADNPVVLRLYSNDEFTESGDDVDRSEYNLGSNQLGYYIGLTTPENTFDSAWSYGPSDSYTITLPVKPTAANLFLKTDDSGTTEWSLDNNTTYAASGTLTEAAENNPSKFEIKLDSGSHSDTKTTQDTITLKAGDGVTMTSAAANEVTLSIAAVPTGSIIWWPSADLPGQKYLTFTAATAPAGFPAAPDHDDEHTYEGNLYIWVANSSTGVPVNKWRAVDPNNIPDFVACEGQALKTSSYTALRNVIGTHYGGTVDVSAAQDGSEVTSIHRDLTNYPVATYPEGDEVGQYFTIPDLRGEFIRGWDDTRGVDPNRVLGSAQGHQLEHHTHFVKQFSQTIGNGGPNNGQAGTNSNTGAGGNPLNQNPMGTFDGTPGSVSDETRPRNVALIAIIKT